MVVPNDGYGGGFGMRSSSSSISAFNHMNAKAVEAELISKATQTAIVAARSILMSGGTEEVALKTAKAAAESVLNPQASDNDTVSGRSTVGSVFGGRKRKAKRQAEVVASMALMSASSGIRHSGSSMDIMTHSSSSAGLGMQTSATLSGISPRKSSRPVVDTSGAFFSSPPQSSPALAAGNAKESPVEPDSMKSQSKEKPKDENTNTSNFLDKILNISSTPKNSEKEKTSTPTPTPKPLTPKLFEMESDSVSQNDTMESEQQSSVGSSLDEYSAAESATVDSPRHSRKIARDKDSSSKYSFDPLLVNVTKALNIFTCGPLGAFSGGQAADDLEELDAINGSRRGRHVESRDDTFDDNTTNYSGDDSNTEMTGRDARDDFRDPDFGMLTSKSSDSSNALLRDLMSSEHSEGAIQVRSSIRETMEKIVSKSKKGGHRRGNSRGGGGASRRGRRTSDGIDKKWLSYELSQHKNDEPEIPVPSSKKKSRRGSSISRRTPKKSGSTKSLGKKQSFFFKNKNKGN
ncbi:MAG: hypothetical protein SGARI_001071 [Bacillariaceae sp.]